MLMKSCGDFWHEQPRPRSEPRVRGGESEREKVSRSQFDTYLLQEMTNIRCGLGIVDVTISASQFFSLFFFIHYFVFDVTQYDRLA